MIPMMIRLYRDGSKMHSAKLNNFIIFKNFIDFSIASSLVTPARLH